MPDPSAYDRGLAPFQILMNLKATHDALGPHASLEGLTTGVRFTKPGLRVVPQPHQAQYVIYDVADDVAARFDCASRLTPGSPAKVSHEYGTTSAPRSAWSGPRKAASIALLWAKEDGYWKIVSWQTEPDADAMPAPPAPPTPTIVRIKADLRSSMRRRAFWMPG